MGIDENLYNDYLNENIEAFEVLYAKYKDRIKYFVFNIIKDYEKAEDIMQDVFVYVMKNKYDVKKGNFKYYIYMIAKTKALTYLNTENRRNNISEKYLENSLNSDVENDILDFIIKEENKKDILESISLINEKYREAMYLVKIEGFSYQEVASILNISIQDVKNYIHRGKSELRKILIKKGFDNMNKVSKILITILCLTVLITGGVYATIKIYESFNGKANIIPSSTIKIGDNNINNIWIGSFQIAWNEFMNERIGREIEFVDGESLLANELNKKSFTKKMLSDEDYYVKVGETSNELKREILTDINNKFKINTSSLLNGINFDNVIKGNSYTIYSILYKNFKFLIPFDRLCDMKFNGSTQNVKYFGIENSSSEKLKNNVEVLFYNNTDFAIKLKTNENEEVILYCNDNNNDNISFNELYNELKNKTNLYNGNRNLAEGENIRIPYIYIDTIISYDELCNREIKHTGGIYISNVIQNVKFSLNEIGGNLKSEGLIKDQAEGLKPFDARYFNYNKPFVIFLKEANKDLPYFALKVDNTDILVSSDEK